MNDRVEKKVTLHAPVSTVWRAIADAKEFGRWFGVQLDGPWAVGKTINGSWENLNEEMIHKAQERIGLPPGKVRMPKGPMVFCTVERIDPERYFSFRWIPFGIDAEADPQNEPTTLVEFKLEKAPEGTLLTIVESGFDKVPHTAASARSG
jgi:uncharacterized protein YndB with AHSA1/START domain